MIPYFTGLGYYGVAIAGAIMLTMKIHFPPLVYFKTTKNT